VKVFAQHVAAAAWHVRRGQWREAGNCVKAYWHQIYEGARRWSTQRGQMPGPPPQDARFDCTNETRTELVRKARLFEANDAIVNRMADLYEQYVIGPNGLQIIPNSSDDKWNEKAKAWFDQWARLPDIASRLSLASLQSIAARREFIDGQIFILKTYGEEIDQGGRAARRPRIQLIETHRIQTPGERAQDEGRTIIDGWEVDSRGRPIAGWFIERDTNEQEKYIRRSADSIITIGEPCRPGQYHSLPYLTPVMQDLQDLHELIGFTKHKAKELSTITRVLETASGELKDIATTIRETAMQRNKNSAGEDITETKTRHMQSVFGPRAIALSKGEKLNEFLNNTPTVADQQLWSHLASRICIGVGIPKILVFPESIQGTLVRGEYDIAATFFQSRSAVHANAWTEVYYFVMDWAIRNVRELSDPPADWRNVSVQYPRAVNVDVGYNAEALLKQVEAGTLTFEEAYGPLGKNWRERLKAKAKQAAYIRQLAKDHGLEVHEISTLQEDRAERFESPEQQPQKPKAADTEDIADE
jgi:hypothetical protein